MSFDIASGKATPDEVERVIAALELAHHCSVITAVPACGLTAHDIHLAAALMRSLAKDHSTAINALQDIAAMGRKAGSETARHTLCQLGVDVPDYGSMT
jgi:hypothetical protein